MPPSPALRMPPKNMKMTISSTERMDPHSVGIRNRVVSMADEASTCDTMLMKMPIMQSSDPMVSALCPYSFATISASVTQPLRRRGTT